MNRSELIFHVRKYVEEKYAVELAETVSEAIAKTLNKVEQIPAPPNLSAEETAYFDTMKGMELGLCVVRTMAMLLGSAEAHASIISDRTPETDGPHREIWNQSMERDIKEGRFIGRTTASKMLDAQIGMIQDILKDASKNQA